MAKSKRTYSSPTHDEKLRYMRVLDSNGMNKSLTARELNISRTTLHRYISENWEKYLEEKNKVNDDSQAIAAKKMLLSFDAENARIKLEDTCARAIDLMNNRIQDQPEAISTKDLVQYINILTPYLLEKKALLGAKEVEDEKPKQPTIIQNFIENLKYAKENKPE